MTANEKRQAVIEKFQTIIGINKYSHPLRDYCFNPYTDGKTYSDSSSSIAYSYAAAGLGFGDMDEVGMYQTDKFVDVDVIIRSGVIRNPEVLRVGDILFFAGTDDSRRYVNFCNNVEMIYHIDDEILICGHSSGLPSLKELNKYCKSRYHRRTATALGNCGLIKVRRFIQDDAIDLSNVSTEDLRNELMRRGELNISEERGGDNGENN